MSDIIVGKIEQLTTRIPEGAPKLKEMLKRAVLEEREACAKLCENMHGYETTGYEYAEAIRARSNVIHKPLGG